jgi:hypothetical protein
MEETCLAQANQVDADQRKRKECWVSCQGAVLGLPESVKGKGQRMIWRELVIQRVLEKSVDYIVPFQIAAKRYKGIDSSFHNYANHIKKGVA